MIVTLKKGRLQGLDSLRIDVVDVFALLGAIGHRQSLNVSEWVRADLPFRYRFLLARRRTALSLAGMRFTVRLQRLSNSPGVRIPYLLNERGIPVQIALRWLVRERLFKVDWTTLRNEMRALSLFYQWAAQLLVDLDARLEGKIEISNAEVKAFARWLRKRPKSKGSLERVTGDTVNTRLKAVGAFCAWATRYRAEFSNLPEIASKAASEETRLLKKFSAEQIRPGIKTERNGLAPDTCARLLKILDPTHANNPFSRDTAFHVQVLLIFMLETGVRLGEAAAVRVTDLRLHGYEPGVFIIKRDNDKDDPRTDAPSVKTLERELPISRHLANLLVQYERRVRGRARHPYFFVSPRQRTPIGMRQIERVFEKLRAVLRLDDFSPHTLRRTFNDIFYTAARTMGWNEEDARRFHTVICGWSDTSSMPNLYSRRAIRDNAARTLRFHQDTLYKMT